MGNGIELQSPNFFSCGFAMAMILISASEFTSGFETTCTWYNFTHKCDAWLLLKWGHSCLLFLHIATRCFRHTVRGTFYLGISDDEIFRKPLDNCSIFSIFWFPRVKGEKSKPQRCDQISFPTAKNYLYFLSISFISCLLVARKGLKRKFKSI